MGARRSEVEANSRGRRCMSSSTYLPLRVRCLLQLWPQFAARPSQLTYSQTTPQSFAPISPKLHPRRRSDPSRRKEGYSRLAPLFSNMRKSFSKTPSPHPPINPPVFQNAFSGQIGVPQRQRSRTRRSQSLSLPLRQEEVGNGLRRALAARRERRVPLHGEPAWLARSKASSQASS